jgi:formylglycine-generating enzyme required for sulfatase activity
MHKEQRRLSTTLLLSLAIVTGGCVDRVPMDKTPCPCVEGWECDKTGICVKSADGSTVVTDTFQVDARADGSTVVADTSQVDASANSEGIPVITKNCSNGWCAIPAGSFTMGSPLSEPCRKSNETQHKVTLTHPFEIAEAETTQEEFEALVGYNPANCRDCGTLPVHTVSWMSAADYCNRLSEKHGLNKCYDCGGTTTQPHCVEATQYAGKNIYLCPGYRLPTEAEWEYAYRAGTTTALYNGTISECRGLSADADAIAWYVWNASKKHHPTKQKQPNAWGLYDMAGNVAEWVNDYYERDKPISAPQVDPVGVPVDTDNFRRFRGGSCCNNFGFPRYIRAAAREEEPGSPGWTTSEIGFRCARTLNP